MIAPREIPDEYSEWNRRHGAPHGRPIASVPFLRRRAVRARYPQLAGPFGVQRNNTTRAYEYPWAFHAVPVLAGTTAVDLGGSLAGFQFVLSRSGVRVVNVDPGREAAGLGWDVDSTAVARLNRAFRTDVELVSARLHEAGLPDNSVETVYSISTIEHIPTGELHELMTDIHRILKPGGSCVLTVDLFLNLEPFSDRETNEYGVNVRPKMLVDASPLELSIGTRSELLGYPEFDPLRVMANLERYLVGDYPALAQCFVLRKQG